MRFQIQLRNLSRKALIPINYQYELSAWIYKVLERGDLDFSTWLHEQGYRIKGKQFKLFTFSALKIPRFERIEDRLQILSPELFLQVSFCLEPSAEHFLKGLFREQHLGLGDKVSQADFEVETIQMVPTPTFGERMRFRALSPICIATQAERKGRNMPQYHHPNDKGYPQLLFNNLINKYLAAQMTRSHQIDVVRLEAADMQFQLRGETKSRLVTLAAHTPRQTRVRGYLYDFELAAPAALLQFAYEAGIGEKNSMGFGCVEEKRS